MTEPEIRAALAALLPDAEGAALAASVGRLPDPQGAVRDLGRLVAASPRRPAPGRLHAFLVLAAYSPYLADLLVREPAFLDALPGRTSRVRPLTREDLEEDLARFHLLNAAAGVSSILRRFRHREYVRIALADFLGVADLAATTRSLSLLADVLLDKAIREARAPLEERFGRPVFRDDRGHLEESGFAVIALGKLGGEELNYSSDIDLLFLYARDGETAGAGPPREGRIDNREYFARLASEVTRLIAGQSAEGQVFRVDLGLRPGGKDGALVTSLAAATAYYRNWAEAWERQALIKARPSAGDAALGRRFVSEVEPLVYPETPDPYLALEIAAMKDRIDARLSAAGRSESDIKLGRGGIRELEFGVQALQLEHGGRDPWVRHPSTLLAMHRLAEKGYLGFAEYSALAEAYVFLRDLEHRLQLGQNRQTSILPGKPEALRLLARRMGIEPGPDRNEAAVFADRLERHREAARRFYDSVVGRAAQARIDEEAGPDLWFDRIDDALLTERLAAAGIGDPAAALRPLRLLRRVLRPGAASPELRRALRRTGPELLRAAAESFNARRAFANLEKLLSVMAAEPEDLLRFLARRELVAPTVRLLGRSDLLGGILIRQPSVLHDMADRGRLVRAPEAREHRERLAVAVRAATGARARSAALRRRHQAETALLAIRDINRQVTLRELLKSLSGLAEAVLQETVGLAADELREEGTPPAPAPAVLGLGRLGYREMDYGSDLDLVFVAGDGGDPEALRSSWPACERIVRLLSTHSRDGQLYRVDLRLRPSGGAGNIVVGRDALLAYLRDSAEVWEMQSFLKARVVAGGPGACDRLMEDVDAVLIERGRVLGPAALARAVRGMRERLAAQAGRGGGDGGVKLGAGGIIEIHFIIEFLQLAHGVRSPEDKDTLRLLTALQGAGLLPDDALRDLYESYLFLRAVEHQKRLLYGRPEAALPGDPARLAEIAAALDRGGDGAGERLREEIEAHRARVRAAYESIVRG